MHRDCEALLKIKHRNDLAFSVCILLKLIRSYRRRHGALRMAKYLRRDELVGLSWGLRFQNTGILERPPPILADGKRHVAPSGKGGFLSWGIPGPGLREALPSGEERAKRNNNQCPENPKAQEGKKKAQGAQKPKRTQFKGKPRPNTKNGGGLKTRGGPRGGGTLKKKNPLEKG